MAELSEKVNRLLAHNVEEAIEKSHLRETLLSGKKLRVKLGIDPTSPDLHLGHAVVLLKLKEFQDLGHKIVLIIGDFTARIGDPSGRSETRKPLSEEEIKANEKEYLTQAAKIIDVKKSEVRHNGEWFEKEGVGGLLKLAAAGTMQQMLRREDFKQRLAGGGDVSVTELLYPLLQGYDSVKIGADVEIGGSDQLFNLLMGRKVQRHFGMKEQDILTTPLLVGLDGKKKMSKSYGNYVGLTDTPDDMFGKTMSLPDKLVSEYFALCTEIGEEEVKKFKKELSLRDLKAQLGSEIVKLYHGEKAAAAAREKFIEVFSKKEMPADLPALKLTGKGLTVIGVVMVAGLAKSKGEARRLVEQGAVEIDDVVKKDANEILSFRGGEVIKIGKHHFFRVKI